MPHVSRETKQQLMEAIDAHDYVSFDVFDTLIFRPLSSPFHVFFLMQKQAAEIIGEFAVDFHKLRFEAENNAREKAHGRGEQDMTLSQVYDELQSLLDLSDEQRDRLKAFEVETELLISQPNAIMQEMVDYAIKQGKKVTYLSDMYLETDYIEDLLRKHDYPIDDNVLVSSEIKKTKHQGDLFAHLITHLGCKPKEILHVGDNIHSDIQQGKSYGLDVFHIPRPIETFFDNQRNQDLWHTADDGRNMSRSVTLGLIANRCYGHDSALQSSAAPYSYDWETFGYYVAGPIYLAFVQWVIEQAQRDGVKKLFFLARDGYVLEKTYQELRPCYEGEDIPEVVYTYSSRRAWKMAAIKKLDHKTLDFLRGDCHDVTIDHLLKRVDLNPDDFTHEIAEANIDRAELLHLWRDKTRVEGFFRSIETAVLNAAAKERTALLAYFHEIGMGDSDDAAIVDVGWHGSLQTNLVKLLREEGLCHDLAGYYFGTKIEALHLHEHGYRTRSFLFHHGEPHHYQHVVYSCMEIFELIFSAPTASFVKMENDGKKLTPVFDEIDINDARISILEDIHTGALALVKDFSAVFSGFPHLKHSVHNTIFPLQKIILEPTPEESRMFDNIWHGMDFGAARLIIEEPSVMELIFHPIRFGIRYRDTFWKAAFEQRLGWFWRKYLHLLLKVYFKLQAIKQRIGAWRYKLRLRTRVKQCMRRVGL